MLRKTWREFSADQCTDLAAALTYYAVLAVFPAMIALTSLLGLIGKGDDSVTTLLGIVEDLGGASMVESVRDPCSRWDVRSRPVSRSSWVSAVHCGPRAGTSAPSAVR